MKYNNVEIEDTFCEATSLFVSRVVLTASDSQTAMDEARYLSGFSIITAAPVQVCVEERVAEADTPDRRPGVLLQLNAPCALGLETFKRAVRERLYILPHLPTCSLFDAWPSTSAVDDIDLRGTVGRWGDGFEVNETVGERDVIRMPIMSGDMLIERRLKVGIGLDAVLEVFGRDAAACLAGARRATARLVELAPGVGVFNYPLGGISGAKVGGTAYTEEGVTINEVYCPSLKARVVGSCVPAQADAVVEFPMVGLTEQALYKGLSLAIQDFCETMGILSITAPRFGGLWGDQRLALRRAFALLEDQDQQAAT